MIDQWQGCYDQGWGKNLVPEAFSHPAKVSFKLAERIYAHAMENHWIEKGGIILDPFGGICGFGFHAMVNGLNFISVELEEKFVKLGEQNIELWKRQLKGWPNLGTARIVQGDSRRLKNSIVGMKDLIISSPPYVEIATGAGGLNTKSSKHFGQQSGRNPKSASQNTDQHYGHTPGNLANMKEGDIDMVVSSPPFVEAQTGGGIAKALTGESNYPLSQQGGKYQGYRKDHQGESPGQLGSMKEGPFDLVCSSPPYEDSVRPTPNLIEQKAKYYERVGGRNRYREARSNTNQAGYETGYSENQDNLGNSSGDTFWSASREIVQGCYELLKPGGHAIWVCKDYVKAKKRVPFSDRWQALCESVGFRLVCRHQALLVKEHGIQMTSYGDKKITTERKSFFRRLAESKGSPRIDWEDILCLVKGT